MSIDPYSLLTVLLNILTALLANPLDERERLEYALIPLLSMNSLNWPHYVILKSVESMLQHC